MTAPNPSNPATAETGSIDADETAAAVGSGVGNVTPMEMKT